MHPTLDWQHSGTAAVNWRMAIVRSAGVRPVKQSALPRLGRGPRPPHPHTPQCRVALRRSTRLSGRCDSGCRYSFLGTDFIEDGQESVGHGVHSVALDPSEVAAGGGAQRFDEGERRELGAAQGGGEAEQAAIASAIRASSRGREPREVGNQRGPGVRGGSHPPVVAGPAPPRLSEPGCSRVKCE